MIKKLSSITQPAFHAHTHWASHPPTSIFFLRHGETDWNVRRVIQGWKGTSLNAVGLKQAALAAKRVERLGLKFDAVVSSDLRRALQTAQVAAARLGAPLKVWKELRERRFGDWEGRSIEQVLSRFKLGPDSRQDPFLSFDPKGGESMSVFARRMQRLLARFEKEYAGKTVLAVTHGGPMRIAACLALKVPPKKYFLLGRPFNSSITLIQSQGGVRWVDFYNDASHLEKRRR